MTAIKKMVEWLHGQNSNTIDCDWEAGFKAGIDRAQEEAHRLALEEAQSKPAPSEPDEFEKYMDKIIGMVLENPNSDERDLLANRYRNILSAYRGMKSKPAPVEAKATGELVEELASIHCIQCGNEGSVAYCAKPNLCSTCVGIREAERKVRDILSRYRPTPVNTDGALVEELREWKRKHFDSDRQVCGSKAFEEILSRHSTDKGAL